MCFLIVFEHSLCHENLALLKRVQNERTHFGKKYEYKRQDVAVLIARDEMRIDQFHPLPDMDIVVQRQKLPYEPDKSEKAPV